MAIFLSAPEAIRLVQHLGLSACIDGIAERIQREFLRWEQFDKSARLACHSTGGVIELMPIADHSQFAFKYVNGHPGNHQHGLPTVMAFGVLADVATGAPLFLSELTLTTAIRTAAMSALAARHLARSDCRTMAIIGNGAQSEFQAIALRDMLGIVNLRLFDTDLRASRKLAKNLVDQGFNITICASAFESVKGADIITTVTADKAYATILTPDMIAPGVHINAVGGDCPGKTELHADILKAARVFVEFEPQSRIEGEIQQMPPDFAVTEFWQVLNKDKSGRRSDSEVTVFDSVGFALEDFAALAFLFDAATKYGFGEQLDLIPTLTNPKDLFGLLAKTCEQNIGFSRRDTLDQTHALQYLR